MKSRQVNKASKPQLVFLDGNIGAGKTTLGRLLESEGCFFAPEPVHMWEDMLQRFYEDQARWAFSLQLSVILSRRTQIHRAVVEAEGRPIVLERSPYCDRDVFARNARETGNISGAEWQLYCSLWTHLMNDIERKYLFRFVYLRTSPVVCLDRVQQRNRAGEEAITLNYLKRLHILHEDWFWAIVPRHNSWAEECNSADDYPRVELIRDWIMDSSREIS